MKNRFVNRIEKLPKGHGWAILRNKNIYVPGDERSRRHPGHGYPAHNEEVVSIEFFDDFAELEEQVDIEVKRGNDFKVVSLTPLEVTTEVKVNIG